MDLAAWHLWWKRSGARELRGILMDTWDPIGVLGVAQAADEYDGYLGPIVQRLRAGDDSNAIAALLSGIVSERMEARPDSAACEATARTLVDWYAGAMAGPELSG
jgi:hypothetical protein